MSAICIWTGLLAVMQITGQAGTTAPSQNPVPSEVSRGTGTTSVHETDFVKRSDFAKAQNALIVVRITDRTGTPVLNTSINDVDVWLNGTKRTISGLSISGQNPYFPPLVLLAFPPNQREVHAIGIKQAEASFQRFGGTLPWKVAVLDADGSLTPYMQQRDDLLVTLEKLSRKTEPIVGAGGWITEAESAVFQMSSYRGFKILLAFNRSADEKVEEGHKTLSQDGPASLVAAALSAGTHIYVANVAGAGVLIPGGDASTELSSDLRQPFASRPREEPSEGQVLVNRSMSMQITALETQGGFAASVDDLVKRIQKDLAATYILEVPLNDQDRDKGIPQVSAGVRNFHGKIQIVDVLPSGANISDPVGSRAEMASIWNASGNQVSSVDFQIAQRVDYFPVRKGLKPVLPMSAQVLWIGSGTPPQTLYVAEYVQDLRFSLPVLEKEVDVNWNGKGIEWERDGQLPPGEYDWRIVLHNKQGRVLGSSDQRVRVGPPETSGPLLSTLVLAAECRPNASDVGLRRRGMKSGDQNNHSQIDPLQLDECRLKPSVAGVFNQGEIAHALVRIYPVGKFEVLGPERWSASFHVFDAAGKSVFSQVGTFEAGEGGGYLAKAEIKMSRLDNSKIEVQISGPGIRKPLYLIRNVTVVAPPRSPK